jgi:hypothetical protein
MQRENASQSANLSGVLDYLICPNSDDRKLEIDAAGQIQD